MQKMVDKTSVLLDAEPLVRKLFPIAELHGSYKWITVIFICILLILTSLFLRTTSPAAEYLLPNSTKKHAALATGIAIAILAVGLRTINRSEIFWIGIPVTVLVLLKAFPYGANGFTTADDADDTGDDEDSNPDDGSDDASGTNHGIDAISTKLSARMSGMGGMGGSKISPGIIDSNGNVQSSAIAQQLKSARSTSKSSSGNKNGSSISSRQKERELVNSAIITQSHEIAAISNTLKDISEAIGNASDAAESFISGR